MKGPLEPVSALTLLRKKRTREPLFLLRRGTGGGGALPLGLGITEIAATAGAGKTQIGLGLCVSCANNKENCNKALYVSLGEGKARIAQRLQQMAEHRGQDSASVLQHILTRCIRNEDEFMTFITKELPPMLHEVGVLVLDSIGGLYRVSQTHPTAYAKRSEALFSIAAQLKKLSDCYQVPIVVINQVTTSLELDRVIPALGLSWASCVNTSYMLSRQAQERDQQTIFARKISLVRSSCNAPVSFSFRIDAGGAVALE